MGGAERRGKLGKDLPSRFGRRAPPPPAGRGQPLKWRRGQRPAEQRDPSAAVWDRGRHTLERSPSFLCPASPPSPAHRVRAQAVVTKLVQSFNAIQEHMRDRKKEKKKITG